VIRERSEGPKTEGDGEIKKKPLPSVEDIIGSLA
jgi:hypothetical protein